MLLPQISSTSMSRLESTTIKEKQLRKNNHSHFAQYTAPSLLRVVMVFPQDLVMYMQRVNSNQITKSQTQVVKMFSLHDSWTLP